MVVVQGWVRLRYGKAEGLMSLWYITSEVSPAREGSGLGGPRGALDNGDCFTLT